MQVFTPLLRPPAALRVVPSWSQSACFSTYFLSSRSSAFSPTSNFIAYISQSNGSFASSAVQSRRQFQSLTSASTRPSPNQPPFIFQSGVARTATFAPFTLLQCRSLSLFPSRNPIPSPIALVRLSRLEIDANANPENVDKQVALWDELMKYPSGWRRIISRYERLIEFDPNSALIRSPAIFKLYVQALLRTDQTTSIQPAVKRRDALLAIPLATTPEPEPEPAPPLSPSEQIAADVMSKSPHLGGALLGIAKNDTWAGWLKSKVPSGTQATSAGSGSDGLPNDGTGGVDGSAIGTSGGKSNPVHVIVEESRGATVFRVLRFVFLTLLYSFIALTILSLFLENSGLLKAGGPPKTMEFEPPTGGKVVKFSDVQGVDEAKHELQEVVQFLKDPTTFATLGGRLPKGVLLTGPPGTGKTMLARAVAGEAGVPFLFASGSEFDEMFVGVGAKRVRELFAAARKKQPSIIFIDELDAIGSRRSPRDQHYVKQTLNQLLVELDGFTQSEGVIVIAATNFPETLDKALVRPGRFDKKIVVPLPDITGRVQILKHHMQGVKTDDEVDPVILARGTPGFSGAELQNMVNQAAIQASREGQKTIGRKHFEWAKDKILMGSERKSAFISEKVKRMTAYHEGGHTLVALYTPAAMPLHKVTCIPRGHSLGMTTFLPETDRETQTTYAEFLAGIDVSMGGRVAEELIYGKDGITSGGRSDLQNASATAKAMVQNYGYSEKIGPVFYNDDDLSPTKRNEIESEIRVLIDGGAARAHAILGEHIDELHRLAEALVEYETLDLDEVKKVIKGEKLSREPDKPPGTANTP